MQCLGSYCLDIGARNIARIETHNDFRLFGTSSVDWHFSSTKKGQVAYNHCRRICQENI